MTEQLLRTLCAEPVHVRDTFGLRIPQAGDDYLPDHTNRFAWMTSLPRYLHQQLARVRNRDMFQLTSRLTLPDHYQSDVLLIVPPFASIWYPSLAAHILQACVQHTGISVDVLYANMLLATVIGEEAYEKVAAESVAMAGERFFARCAFALPPLGHGAAHAFDPHRIYGEERGELYSSLWPDGHAATGGIVQPITLEELQHWEQITPAWIEQVATIIGQRGYRIVGCTTTFQQTNASIALLNRIKELYPAITTVLGGANCEGEMAEGLYALQTRIDYIFSGESEATFPDFVRAILTGHRPDSSIVYGHPVQHMDDLPWLTSDDFFQQRKTYLPHSVPLYTTWLTYETSRGCWWGQKNHCTFCGLNGEGMGFRHKSPDRMIRELRALLHVSPTNNISMTDNIMPHTYFKTLLSRLSKELPEANVFYEQKANLSFEDIVALKHAGVHTIQPGIEALSTPLLKLMRKGVTARQNLMLLRYCRIAGVHLLWNLICGFPRDEVAMYQQTMDLVPLIPHLQPPSGLWHLSIDRFSPYFFQPEVHQVTNLRPQAVYRDILPAHANIDQIAYHFLGDYPSDTHRCIDLIRTLSAALRTWTHAWHQDYQTRPELKICLHEGQYVLIDTRNLLHTEPLRYLDDAEAHLLMNARPQTASPAEHQAVQRKLAVIVDNWFVPLPVAQQAVFEALSTEGKRPAKMSSPPTSDVIPLAVS